MPRAVVQFDVPIRYWPTASLPILMFTESLHALRTYLHGNGAVLLPEMELLLFATGTLVMDSRVRDKHKYWNPTLALAGTVFSGLTLWMLRVRTMQSGDLSGFHQTMIVDSYFLFFATLLLAATALVVLLSANTLTIPAASRGRYYALLLFACVGMMLMVSAVDLLVIFLALEIAAISFYFLVAIPGSSKQAHPAAIKFLLSSAFASSLMAYGFSLLYGLSAATNVGQIASALARRHSVAKVIALSHQPGAHGAQMYQLLQSRLPEAVHWHPFMLETLPLAAFVLIVVGLIFRISAAPFHRAPQKPHSGIPVTVLTYFCGAFTIATIALLLRFLLTVFADSQNFWSYIMAVLAPALIAGGILASFLQTNLERILVCSSLAQAGYLLLGLISADDQALTAMVYYLFTYLFILTGIFAVLIVLRHKHSTVEDLSDLHGLRQRSPVTALLLIVFVVSLAGFPPTAGFFGRYFIFRSLLESGHRALAWFDALSALPLACSYLRVAVYAWRNTTSQTEATPVSSGVPEALVLGVCLFVSVAAGLYSDPFTRMARYAFGQ
jgi:NADH-quinone oxidoreductase subunit N